MIFQLLQPLEVCTHEQDVKAAINDKTIVKYTYGKGRWRDNNEQKNR